jgi:NAD(P)-dependent dehydrogenase (short-subunit alcohol dehydrogenase family)
MKSPTSQQSMAGKTCLVTGATSGIGKATAQVLAELGAVVVIVGRNQKRCQETIKHIRKRTGNPHADYLLADLSSQGQLRKLADEVKRNFQRLDVLINNAGAKFVSCEQTVDGYEMTFALNHLAYFLLTNLLIEPLKASAKARVINVSSGAHAACHGINFDDLQGQKNYNGKQAYAQSKLANLLFTYELARRLEGTRITANALTPGGVITNFGRNNGWISWGKHVAAHLLARNLVGPKKGAQTSIYLATSSEVEGMSGKYFSNMKTVQSSKASYDSSAAKRLWQVSLDLTGLTDILTGLK